MARNEHMIAALKRERAGYAAAGDGDRVAAVDEQLKHFGYEGQQDPPAVTPTDDDGAPKGRTTRPRRTATRKGGKQAAAKTPEAPPVTPSPDVPEDGPSKDDGQGA